MVIPLLVKTAWKMVLGPVGNVNIGCVSLCLRTHVTAATVGAVLAKAVDLKDFVEMKNGYWGWVTSRAMLFQQFIFIYSFIYFGAVVQCGLEGRVRKVLRPATSTQVFLGFPVSVSKCWDGTQDAKLPLHASHVVPPDLNLVVNTVYM